MTLFGSGTVNGLAVINEAQLVAKNTRDALTGGYNFYNWIVGQASADLEAAGVASPDVATMEGMAADLYDLWLKYNGGAGTITLPHAYSISVNTVCGPQ